MIIEFLYFLIVPIHYEEDNSNIPISKIIPLQTNRRKDQPYVINSFDLKNSRLPHVNLLLHIFKFIA